MSEKIKVCHITSVHAESDTRIFFKECVSLAEAGFEVHFVVPNAISRIEKGVHIHGVELAATSRLQRMRQMTKMVYQKALSIDAKIYHFHDPELLPYGLKLSKKGKKVIYDAHEDVPRQILGKYWIPGFVRPLLSKAFEWYEDYVAKRMSHVVVSTPTIEKRFVKVNPKSTAICNYPILSENTTIPIWENRKNEVCYIGGLNEIRGIKELVQSLEHAPNMTLHLAGNFSPAEFRDELKQLPKWNQVKEYGYLDRAGVVNLLNNVKIGMVTLYPQVNYLDSLPIKLYEYMLAEMPVIASDFPLWKEIIAECDCGLTVNPKDPAAIAEAYKQILLDDDRAREMGKNGRKAVLERFNWGIEKDKLIAIYHQLAK